MADEVFFDLNGKFLYLDSYLVDFDIPIFYICKDDEYEKYAVMCVNSHEDEYIICKVTNIDIKAMLENRMTLREFIVMSEEKWHSIYDSAKDDDNIETISAIQEQHLPKKGEFLNLYNKRVADYLRMIDFEIKTNDIDMQLQKVFQKYQFIETKKMMLINKSNIRLQHVLNIADYNMKFITESLSVSMYSKEASLSMKKHNVYIQKNYNRIPVKKISLTY